MKLARGRGTRSVLLRSEWAAGVLFGYALFAPDYDGAGEAQRQAVYTRPADVLGYLAAGMSHEELLKDFPYLTEEDIRDCLAFAADRERRLETMVA